MDELLRVCALLALVAGNAFFVIGEYAVVTARRGRLAARADAGSPSARAALGLMDDPVRVISTVQVGITAIGVLTGAIGQPLVQDMIGGGLPGWLGFLIAFTAITYLTVVLGELVPKALTLDRAETLVVLVAPPIALIATVLRPAVWILQSSAEVLLRPFGVREVVAGDAIRSPEELRAVVDEAEESGVIPRAQEELLHRVFDFADREARDIMVPAAAVAWLDADLDAAAALDRVIEDPHARYPVARRNLDDLVGVVHVRDVIAAMRSDASITLGELTRPAYVVPETKDVGALLREQREQREQLAVVADEYGRTVGIVTVEDVVEEIVGEIEDEYSLPDSTLTWLSDGAVEASGSMTIDDFNESTGAGLPQRGPRTLAGLVFDALGRRPHPGDVTRFDQVELHVKAVSGPRITTVQVILPAPRGRH